MLEEVSNRFLQLEMKYEEDLQRVKMEAQREMVGGMEDKRAIEAKLEEALEEIRSYRIKE